MEEFQVHDIQFMKSSSIQSRYFLFGFVFTYDFFSFIRKKVTTLITTIIR